MANCPAWPKSFSMPEVGVVYVIGIVFFFFFLFDSVRVCDVYSAGISLKRTAKLKVELAVDANAIQLERVYTQIRFNQLLGIHEFNFFRF